MPRDWKALPSGGMMLLNESGDGVETLKCDPVSGQYRTSNGVSLGKKWEDARDACIALAVKAKRILPIQ